MNRPTVWLLAAVLVPVACAPRSARREPGREKGEDPAEYQARLEAYYAGIGEAVDDMLPRIYRHARALADLGPRQTGQEGCDLALEYIREALAEAAPGLKLGELSCTVTVGLDRTRRDDLKLIRRAGAGDAGEFSHVTVTGLGEAAQDWPAYAFAPNCVQACATHPPAECPDHEPGRPGPFCRNCETPRRLVDLGRGSWADVRGQDLTDAVVLLDFNSGDAWLQAASLGAAGALFIEPEQTTVFQADRKYLATLPLNVPRLYLRRADGLKLRRALAGGADDLRVALKSRLRLVNVPAQGVELTIPGKEKQRPYCFVLAGHYDARCIVPDLSYGGAEVWGIAELIELTRYLAANQPNCDIRVIFVSGHWQSQQLMRQYVAKGGPHHNRIGRYYKVAMGVDLVPQGRSVNLMVEGSWDVHSRGMYRWIGNRLFTDGGWRDRMFAGLKLPTDEVELYGGNRPFLSETEDGSMADRSDRSAFMYAPRYPTAEQAFQTMALPTFAFQTSRLTRLAHNTPLDRLGPIDAASAAEKLRPQLKIALGVLRHLQDYPRKLMRDNGPSQRRGGRGWGGYAQLRGRILEWDRSIGWFAERLPGSGTQQQLRTFLHAYPTDRRTTSLQGARLQNYLNWPQNPSREQHRELQSFMFQDLRLLENPNFTLKTVYAGFPDTQYDVVAYSLDQAGRIHYATDYGVHGDGNKAFQCTDMNLEGWDVYVPVSMFECGTLELFALTDPQRYDPGTYVFGSFYHHYGQQHADGGVAPHLKVTGVKTVDSHTDMERYGFTQYGPTAMVFLPARSHAAAEVLLGSYFTNIAVLNNPDAEGRSRGYQFRAGEGLRLTSTAAPTPLACLKQLRRLDGQRLAEFKLHDVASPLAKRYHQQSAEAIQRGDEAKEAGDMRTALAHYSRGWSFESQAYRHTLKLLLDVVATTVLYFVLLIPFSILVERLLFPQRTVLKTALVSVTVFVVFAAVLYLFHPGFKLAHNVIVTTTAFVIVVMTIPALILLLMRGVAMLRAIGSKAVITQRSEAESAGVVMAALSLAVSNMRRRKLRTALTLLTITTLVMALVLLTTSAAFDFKILEPSGTTGASWQGLQIHNARDRRQALLTEMVEVYEAALGEEALVLRREGVNYGYNPDLKHNGAIFLRANGRKAALPYLQLMDHRDDQVEYTIVSEIKAERLRKGTTFAFVVAFAAVPVLLVLVAQTVRSYRSRGLPGAVKPLAGAVLVAAIAALVVYMTFAFRAPEAEESKEDGAKDVGKSLHLSDLLTPEYNGQGSFFAPGDVDVCLLPNNIAEKLDVKVGDTITLMGLPLTVKGIFAGQTKTTEGGKTLFIPGDLTRLNDLDGLPITTMRGAMFRQGEADNPLHAPASEVVIVPRAWNREYGIFPSVVHSLVIIPTGSRQSPGKIPEMAERLATEILNVDVFSHYLNPKTGRSVANRISMHTATHVKGSTMMVVVLAVAVLMVLAIMTGTVYERMREIHIFSSVGLSPRHVAGMFLIEALVYAGIAAVLGYFLGIISLKGLLWYLDVAGQKTDFYPNYLGVFVVYSIGIAVLATVASSLYPIRLASKIVNPSEARTWQLDAAPEGESGDRWRIRLPFIATTWEEARAMMAYAYDYLVIHQGERSGRFVCQQPPRGRRTADTVELAMPVWLAPFERNLTQDAVMRARPAEDAEWWVLWLDLDRRSGPPYLWRRGATVFVNMLCKHLLRWRAATPQQETDCLERSEGIFPVRE